MFTFFSDWNQKPVYFSCAITLGLLLLAFQQRFVKLQIPLSKIVKGIARHPENLWLMLLTGEDGSE
jgi:hypothetical protein